MGGRPNTENFAHSLYFQNQVPSEQRDFDFDILNGRDRVEIKKENTQNFRKRALFKKNLDMCTPGGQYTQITVKSILRHLPGMHLT